MEILPDLLHTKREELREKYFPENKSLLEKVFGSYRYTETSQLANSQSSFSPEGLLVRNSVSSSIFQLLIIHGVQLLLFFLGDTAFRNHPIHIIFQILFTLAAIFCWERLLNRKPQLLVDSSGIHLMADKEDIRWENVVLTLGSLKLNGKTTTEYLVIHHFVPWKNEFEEKEIDLDVLDASLGKIASAIEYYNRGSI
jgi:hypothetical protein